MEDLKSFDLEVSDEVFFLFSDLIYKTSGIRLTFAKKGLIISRLLKRLKLLGIRGFYDYYHRVREDNEELIEMLNCISTNTTMFFRENYHFEYLRTIAIPSILNKKDRETIRIWSAGCSTGEEPYSIAIAVNEALGRHNNDRDIRILATDISTHVLEAAQTGIYEHEQLPEDMPADMTGRYFLKGIGENDGKIRLKDFIKGAVRFRRLNLKMATYPFKRSFDIIFCRNVMIYFDEDMKRHVLSMFYNHLSNNGYLFLGHSETMIGRETFKPVFVTVYKKF